MTAAFVKCTELRSGSNSASGSVTATAGNQLIAVAIEFGATSGGFTVSGGGTWTTDKNGTINGTLRCSIASCPSATGGTNTITVTATNGSGTTVFILEYSGLQTSPIFEGAGTSNSGTSATPATSALTNTQADAVKIAVTGVDSFTNTAFSSTGTGWTLPTNGSEPDGGNWLPGACGYKIVSASQSDTETWSRTGSNAWDADIATYLGTSAGGGSTALTGGAAAQAVAAAALALGLSAASAAQAAVAAALKLNLVGSATTQALAAAVLALRLSGAAGAQGTASAGLSLALTGSAAAAGSGASGTLLSNIALSGSATGQATSTTAPAIALSGVASVGGGAVGTLTGGSSALALPNGSMAGQALVEGFLLVAAPLGAGMAVETVPLMTGRARSMDYALQPLVVVSGDPLSLPLPVGHATPVT